MKKDLYYFIGISVLITLIVVGVKLFDMKTGEFAALSEKVYSFLLR